MSEIQEEQGRRISRGDLIKGGVATGVALGTSEWLLRNAGDALAATTDAAAVTPRKGGQLTVAFNIPSSDSLDPQNFVAGGDKIRAFNVTERLAMINQDGTVKLHLAQSVVPRTKNAKVWRVTLRRGIQHSNGKELTADDVLFSFRRLARPKAAYASQVTPFIDYTRTRKVDKYTVDFYLKRAIGDFRRFLAIEPFGILPVGSNTFTKPSDLIGTGPYKISSWTPGQRYTMVRNPTYWEKGKPYLDKVTIISLDQNADAAAALLAGQIDGTGNLTDQQIQQLSGKPGIRLLSTPGVQAPDWYMRLDSAAFADNRVRQAFRLAIDRKQCVAVQLGGRGRPGNDLLGVLFPSYNRSLPQRQYDPDKAASLLKQAGQSDIAVELYTANFPDAATAYKEQAKKAGINITIKQVPPADIYNTSIIYLKVPFGETLWTGSFEEISTQGLLSKAFYNETAWRRPAWDNQFLKGFGTVNDKARLKIYWDLQEQLYNEGGYIAWGLGNAMVGAAANVRGVVPWGTVSLWNGLRFESIWRTK